MKHQKLLTYATVHLIILLAFPLATQAGQLVASAYTSASGDGPSDVNSSGSPILDLTKQDTGSKKATAGASVFTASASATVFADYGILRATATSKSDNPFDTFTSGSEGRALGVFLDTLIISNPLFSGQHGILHALVDVRGSAVASDSGAAGSEAVFTLIVSSGADPILALSQDVFSSSLNGIPGSDDEITVNGQNVANPNHRPDILSGVYAIDVPILFDLPFPLKMSVELNAGATAQVGIAGASAEFGNSIYWGGITSVTDANGNPVNFDLSSGSGQNYLSTLAPTAVPVPAAIWLFGSSLLGVAPYLRRKRKNDC